MNKCSLNIQTFAADDMWVHPFSSNSLFMYSENVQRGLDAHLVAAALSLWV
jgi:hypothetical protein